MKWEKRNIAELITTKKGFAFQSKKYVDNGVPIVRVSDFTLDSISDNDLKYYPLSEKANYMEFELHEKDVIIQTVGSWQNNPASVVGKVVRVPYFLEGALLNQNAVKLIPNDNAVNDFLFYRLKTDEFKGHVIGEARGAANQASITLDTIKSFSFLCPPIETQHRIASILSAYDDLIENNQKQIKLLEEAAQRLYKEWFVDLRFPNYENTPVVDGVPEGWRIGHLDELGEFKRGKTITKDSVISGNVPVVAGGLEPAYFHNTANTVAPVVTVSGSGANAGFTRMYHVNVWASDCSFVDSNTTENIYMIYCYLKANKADLDRLQKGAAQPHVYAKDINAMTIMIANNVLLLRLNEAVSPIFTKIGNLFQQIEKLKEARDRLLPKLMSGELEV